jgi:hypothetical protein
MTTPILSGWRKRLGGALLLSALLLATRPTQAQVDTYQFAASTGTFTPLPATATAVTGIYVDDAVTGLLPLGFTFVYDGTPYTQFTATSNGWLSFNPSAASQAGNILYNNGLASTTNGAIKPLVAPFWDDLTGSGGTAKYQTTGTAPNRVFTFEFLDWRRLGATGAQFSIQVKLFETTNLVQYIYRQEATALTDATASIGLAGAVAGTPASTSFLSLSDATPTASVNTTTETTTIASPPATGQIYTFTPPVPSACPTPRNLTATVTNTTATLNWTVSNGTGPFTVIYGPTGFNPATGGTTLSPVTGSSTNITGLTPNTAYQFYVTQNCGGTAGNSSQSNAGSFTTNPNPAVNDNCAQAITLPVTTACATPLSGTVYGATQSTAPTANCGGGTANDVWYSFTATSTSHTINMTSQFGAAYDVRSGACAATTSIYCNTIGAAGTINTTIGGLTSGQLYFIRIYSSGTAPAAGSSNFTLCVTPGPATPANDDCAGAINVPIQYGTCVGQTSADNTAATNSTGAPAPTCASYQEKDIWFKVTVPVSGDVSIQTVAPTAGSSIIDTGLSVYSGTCGNLVEVDCDDDGSPNGAYSLLDLTGRTPGEVLYIRVWDYTAATPTGLIAVCATSPSNCAVPTGPAADQPDQHHGSTSPGGGGTPSPGDTFEIEYGVQGFTPAPARLYWA